MLFKDEAEVVVVTEKGTKCTPRWRQKIVIEKAALKRGLLSARSSRGAQLALYLYSIENQALVSTEDMFCQMRICVGDTRLLPASGNCGVHVNIIPALDSEKLNGTGVLEICIDTQEANLIHGFAMICLRRLASEPHEYASSSPYPILPSIRRNSTSTSSPTAEPRIVRKRSAQDMGCSTTSTNPSTPAAMHIDDNDDVEIGDQIVNLTCPLSLTRIHLPGKGRNCKHVQCFDVETFIQIYLSSPVWKCGVCNLAIEKTDLTISEPFIHYLASYPNADRCVIRKDGTHMPYQQPHPPGRRNSQAQVVDLEDDEAERRTSSHQAAMRATPSSDTRMSTVEPPDLADRYGGREPGDVPAGGLCAGASIDHPMSE
ncbi:SUMO ligase siz1 [Rhizophlyctis rosea]|nr:SUMO ligase siz1 [Rhizophlyctis rosea]